MQLFIPKWVSHSNQKKKKTPIFSLSVHPELDKLATGGQDCSIKIWDLSSIRSGNSEPDCLSTLSVHTGVVLCVRWSPDGNYLASGSDDTKIVIWTLDNSSYRNTGFGGGKSAESYRAVKVLMGHGSDVADLAWSPDGVYLASCGFDSQVFIWDTHSFGLLKKIAKHSGFVKGVTWDPLGKYLATQSDDKTTRIFRVSDWEQEKEISAPYAQSASTTFFRRPSWSPDGGCIATANGESGSLFVASIINRDDWTTDISLVGHEAPIEVAAFNPVLFEVQKDGEPTVSAVCAIGSQDNGVSIWWTSHSRAVVAARMLFTHSVLDLAWTPDGKCLLACSYDGSIACFEFKKDELGRPLSLLEKDRVLSKYGLSVSQKMMIEQPEQLLLEKKLASMEANAMTDLRENDMVNSMMSRAKPTTMPPPKPLETSKAPVTSVNIVNTSPLKQKVTVGKDGKKRIQPTFLASPDQDIAMGNQFASGPVLHAPPQNGIPTTVAQPAQNNGDVQATSYVLPMVQSSSPPTFLAIPALRATLCSSVMTDDGQFTFECRNERHGSRMICLKDTEQLWNVPLVSKTILMAASTLFVGAANVDGTITLMSLAGRLLLPCIPMGSVASYIDVSGAYLLYLGSTGNLVVWNVPEQKVVLSDVSVLTLLGEKEAGRSVSSVKIDDQARVFVNTSLQETFYYYEQLKAWVPIHDRRNPKRTETDQSLVFSHMKIMKRLLRLDQIEEQLARALVMNEKPEVSYWLKIYARRLADEQQTAKATELCNDLLESESCYSRLFPSDQDRKSLLGELVPILSSNRGFQRLLIPVSSMME